MTDFLMKKESAKTASSQTEVLTGIRERREHPHC